MFARLYAAQTASLLGDALTWVGLALLAYELGGGHSAQILAFALTLRVSAFVLLSPLAGLLADRLNRKTIMVTADVVRMVVIGAGLTSLAVLPGNRVGLWPLMGLWLLAGAGQNWVNLSTQTLSAEQTKATRAGFMAPTSPGAICGGPLPTHWPAGWARASPALLFSTSIQASTSGLANDSPAW